MLFFYNSSDFLIFIIRNSQFYCCKVTELRVFDKSVYLSIININILAKFIIIIYYYSHTSFISPLWDPRFLGIYL